ncbi:contact-dependent growth inhibition system immunity protein [Paludifilum halophilum]|uniref:CdiI immunity protein domain-containing protein n=1 Tax=Paludifilum halophilum TaxID=1642702 RepID=A0A235B1D4_9BACL|nr:contact-dependent growth inhibition system immunity protein [Paludifilum halophilum]OYD06084.1 hypothetical protein CHM34_18190 [Paludifilum halophilum]
MCDQEKIKDEMFDFLASEFHQDIESPEEALQELIRESDYIVLDNTLKFIKKFLELKISQEEKSEFIKEHACIYFPAIGMTPLEWLKKIATDLEQSVKVKKAEEKGR